MKTQRLVLVLTLLLALLLVACEEESTDDNAAVQTGPADLTIVSGSENRSLEPIIQDWARERGVTIQVDYLGSLDIMLMLQDAGNSPAGAAAMEYDAVWPANSLWLELGDQTGITNHDESILRSPVVLGIKRSVAEELGWIDAEVSVADIVDAAEANDLQLMMTSATQSNSGASAYFGFLYALSGSPELITSEDLNDPNLQPEIRRVLGTIDRSSRSSGFLKDLFLQRYEQFDGMYNYEAIIIETNQELEQRDRQLGTTSEPLYVIYPTDGMAIADSPLAYVDKGDDEKEELFLALQAHLLTEDVQRRLTELGRRTGNVGLGLESASPDVFREEWGIDLELTIVPIQFPRASVIDEALNLYQTAFRKGSFTVYCLDYSGSMTNEVQGQNITGEQQLEAAMRILLIQEEASRYLLQASDRDVTIIIPFDQRVRDQIQRTGNDADELAALYTELSANAAGGATELYLCLQQAQTIIRTEADLQNQFPAIIAMTDGVSERTGEQQVRQFYATGDFDVPIYSITFGNADETQLESLAELSAGDVYDGTEDLIDAFRRARGNN